MERKKFSRETMMFRALSRKEKFQSTLELCEKLGAIPRHYSTQKMPTSEYERVRGQFYINMNSAKNRNQLSIDDIEELKKIEAYGGRRIPVSEKINSIHEFMIENGRLPTDDDDDEVVSLWKSLKTHLRDKNLEIDAPTLEKMKEIKKKIVESTPTKKDKLQSILDFCAENNRTPKQHSKDIVEKRLADTLSSIKQLKKKNPLDKECTAIFDSILTFSPPPRILVKKRKRRRK